MALAAAILCRARKDVVFLSGGTDGQVNEENDQRREQIVRE